MHAHSSTKFFFSTSNLSHYLLHNDRFPRTVCSMNLWRYTSDARLGQRWHAFLWEQRRTSKWHCLLFHYYVQHTRVQRRRFNLQRCLKSQSFSLSFASHVGFQLNSAMIGHQTCQVHFTCGRCIDLIHNFFSRWRWNGENIIRLDLLLLTLLQWARQHECTELSNTIYCYRNGKQEKNWRFFFWKFVAISTAPTLLWLFFTFLWTTMTGKDAKFTQNEPNQTNPIFPMFFPLSKQNTNPNPNHFHSTFWFFFLSLIFVLRVRAWNALFDTLCWYIAAT